MSDDRRGLKNLGEERCLGDEGGERKIMIASGRPEGARMNNYECTRICIFNPDFLAFLFLWGL